MLPSGRLRLKNVFDIVYYIRYCYIVKQKRPSWGNWGASAYSYNQTIFNYGVIILPRFILMSRAINKKPRR